MSFLKRNLISVLPALFLSVLYLATRLYNILSLPMFTDEAIYTRWSQIASNDAAWRFISLTDGKQPSFVWLNMIFMRLIEDPLLSGRLVSVFAGFVTLVGIYFLTSEIFKNKKIGLAACLLYVLYPFSLVYDRMALYDSLVAASTVWAIYLEVLLIRLRRLDVALILGIVLGFGVLTKTSAFFSIYLLPLSLFMFDFKRKNLPELIKWVGLAGISTIMAYGFYSVLRLSPFFHIISEKNNIFIYTFDEWTTHPFRFLVGNFNGLTDWFVTYATIPVFLLIFSSFFIGGKKFLREKLFLFVWFLIPFFALALFGKVLYPRFILFMTMPLIPLAAFSLVQFVEVLNNSYTKVAFILFSIFLLLNSDYFIVNDFAHAPIPKSDLEQYINSWPAGGGSRELVQFLSNESKKGRIYVATEGTFGSLPTYTIEIYLDDNKNIEKRGMWPLPKEIPTDLADKAKKMKVYFVLNQSSVPPEAWPLKLVAKYQKGIGDHYMSVYEVIPGR